MTDAVRDAEDAGAHARRRAYERVATDAVELIENLVHDAPPPRPARESAPVVVARRRRPLAGASLTASVFGLTLSWLMPWAMPVSILGAVLAIVALRRTWEQREPAWWGLGLGVAGAACASFWIGWIITQLSAATAG